MFKQKRIIGAVVRIPLANTRFGYAQILDKASYAFFNYFTKDEKDDVEAILRSEVLFILSAYDDIVTKGRWKKIGKGEVHKSLTVLPAQFIQDKINPAKFRIYDPNTGNMRNASKEECIGLEKAAVWEAWEIEERLQNYNENKPDKQ